MPWTPTLAEATASIGRLPPDHPTRAAFAKILGMYGRRMEAASTCSRCRRDQSEAFRRLVIALLSPPPLSPDSPVGALPEA